jgi:hypothetical protein
MRLASARIEAAGCVAAGIRWLVSGLTEVVPMLVVAWVLLVPPADWLVHHDVGSTVSHGAGDQLARERDRIEALPAAARG